METKAWAREEAVKILSKVLRQDAYSNVALKHALDTAELSRVDKALVTEIVNGTLKNLIRIDWIISQYAKTKKLSPWTEDILRSGVYQIFYLDRVPDSAVCNESANLARKLDSEGSVKFVNGVLRNIARNRENIVYPDKGRSMVKYLSVMYSHPEWIVKKWLADYGLEFTEELLKADNETPKFSIRVNRLRAGKEELKKMLAEEEVEYEDGLYNEEALYIRGTSSIEDKPSFEKGLFQVQDESSMLVAHVVDPKPGELIIDVCSAPGGKTTHMAELMDNKGTIIARDIHVNKLKLVENSSSRLGIDIVRTEVFNAREKDAGLEAKADRVLVDAPCSGLGVVRRKPDLRWKKQPDNFVELSRIQLEILSIAGSYVKPGGVLVYSTCTINRGENLGIVERFLKKNQAFEPEDISAYLPEKLRGDTAHKGYLELYPNVHGTDGFFIARLKRKQMEES